MHTLLSIIAEQTYKLLKKKYKHLSPHGHTPNAYYWAIRNDQNNKKTITTLITLRIIKSHSINISLNTINSKNDLRPKLIQCDNHYHTIDLLTQNPIEEIKQIIHNWTNNTIKNLSIINYYLC